MKKNKMLLFGGVVIFTMLPNISRAASDYIVDDVGTVCYEEDDLDSESDLYHVVHCPIDVYKSIYDDKKYYENYSDFISWADEFFSDTMGACPEMLDDMDPFDSDGMANRCYVDVTDTYVAICARVGEDKNACNGCKLPSVGDLIYDEWVEFDDNETLSQRKKITSLAIDDNYESWKCKVEMEMDYEYSCNAGYYTKATNLNSTSQCTRCPDVGGGVYGTSPIGNTSIENCCIAAGTAASDAMGTFVFESECCYTE
ncbi:MAG: hypothetical protein IJX89_04585 [Alphaproteobacteria bacterium]|nr:hypothetical protein [Alphaproteobacteria bacterium]